MRAAGESNSPATVVKKSVETDSCVSESSSDDFPLFVAREFASLAVRLRATRVLGLHSLSYWRSALSPGIETSAFWLGSRELG